MSGKTNYLGEFEHIVLLALFRLGDDAYGVSIRATLKSVINRQVSIGALYSTLERLEKKGYIVSRLGASTSIRGGRAKRFFKPTAKGAEALKTSIAALKMMWEGVSIDTLLNVQKVSYA